MNQGTGAEEHSLAPGKSLDGVLHRWTVLQQLKTGGTAVIVGVVAEDGSPGVIKLLSGHRFEIDEALRKRHLREVEALCRIKHRNVLSVLDIVDLDGSQCLVLERATASLHDEMAGSGRAQTAMALIWLREAAKGLGAIHDLGIVHRDVTPKNLLRMADGRTCVGDLGTIRGIDEETLTRRADRIGSLLYISPQQATDPHAATPADDVFSLGQVGYFLLTGRRPQGNPPSLSQAREDLPLAITAAIERLRSEDRPSRPRDGNAAAVALDLPLETWMDLSVRLAQGRNFDEALQAMNAGFDFRKPKGMYLGDTPLQWLYATVAYQHDPALELRLARWVAECFPGHVGETTLFEAERNWKSRMGEMPVLHPNLPVEQGALIRTLAQHWHIFRQLTDAVHRISARRRVSSRVSPSDSLGLKTFGLRETREALVSVESMLALQWRHQRPRDFVALIALLPSRWCAGFDPLDEALVAIANEVADESSDFLQRLLNDGEGYRLWNRWKSSIDRLCRCERHAGRSGKADTLVERVDCPFIRLMAASEQIVDFEAWAALWRDNPRLQAIEYASAAADTAIG
jgi:serine/threonine protein kinase